MRVLVRFYGSLYEHTRVRETYIDLPEKTSLRGLIERLDTLFPGFARVVLDERGVLKRSIVVIVDGSPVQDNEKIDSLVLSEGSQIAFLPPAVGGSARPLRPQGHIYYLYNFEYI